MSVVMLLAPLILSLAPAAFAQQDSFDRIPPEDAGFSSEGLEDLRAYLDSARSSAVVLAYDGKIFFEWGDIHRKHVIHSIRKPLLNSLYGIYVGKGVIDTSATLRELAIDDMEPALTETEQGARIADLLKSRSGIYHDAAAVSEGMAAGKPDRGEHRPGEAYYYNNWDFNTLGAIFEQLTGQTIYEAFYREIARPIGMRHYSGTYETIEISEDDLDIPSTDGFYQYERDKSRYPAYHFRMSAHDLALFGTLYMNRGRWDGEQIVPESWIDASTRSYSKTNEYLDFGYGMLWNVINENEDRPSRSFFHTGAGIHMLGVYPASKLVFVHRVDTEKDYDFPEERLYRIISLVFAAQEKER